MVAHFLLLFYFVRNRELKDKLKKTYVHLIADVEIIRGEYVIKRSEIVDEITTILKEWHDHFKKFFLVREKINLYGNFLKKFFIN